MVTRSTEGMSAFIGTMIFRTPKIPALHQRFPITNMFLLTLNVIEFPRLD